MLFVESWLTDDVVWCVVISALSWLCLKIASRNKERGVAKLVLRVVAGVAGVFVTFLIALTLLFGLNTRYSAPVYSPSGDKAVRVRSISVFDVHLKKDIVELFTRNGLRNETLFLGELGGVQSSSIKWINDAELVVSYSKRIDLGGCKSAANVKVSCISISTTQ